MNRIKFIKYSGAGNDFILIDDDENKEADLTPEKIRKICNRRYGIGADGILLISGSSDYDFTMTYYNSDGSLGSLCGNGARCAIKYAKLSGIFSGNTTKFMCNSEIYSGEVHDFSVVKFNLNQPQRLKHNFKIKILDQLVNASFIDTGSPHVVIDIHDIRRKPEEPGSFYKNISELPVVSIGRSVRNHKDFMPEGTNVNFISVEDSNIYIRTYERGVEDETLACGTGSVAAALIVSLNRDLTPPVTLITGGGDKLTVNFDYSNNYFSDVSLTGPAEEIFNGEILV
ncbi:MAG: diaminopimelate epimerase [Melioribacteraceae bacterium]|nr:diaminopimelate epimerase [Melioribacteraceae bacterium]